MRATEDTEWFGEPVETKGLRCSALTRIHNQFSLSLDRVKVIFLPYLHSFEGKYLFTVVSKGMAYYLTSVRR